MCLNSFFESIKVLMTIYITYNPMKTRYAGAIIHTIRVSEDQRMCNDADDDDDDDDKCDIQIKY